MGMIDGRMGCQVFEQEAGRGPRCAACGQGNAASPGHTSRENRKAFVKPLPSMDGYPSFNDLSGSTLVLLLSRLISYVHYVRPEPDQHVSDPIFIRNAGANTWRPEGRIPRKRVRQ
jgi:hypothetical protein